jgi:hypothetical protein
LAGKRNSVHAGKDNPGRARAADTCAI